MKRASTPILHNDNDIESGRVSQEDSVVPTPSRLPSWLNKKNLIRMIQSASVVTLWLHRGYLAKSAGRPILPTENAIQPTPRSLLSNTRFTGIGLASMVLLASGSWEIRRFLQRMYAPQAIADAPLLVAEPAIPESSEISRELLPQAAESTQNAQQTDSSPLLKIDVQEDFLSQLPESDSSPSDMLLQFQTARVTEAANNMAGLSGSQKTDDNPQRKTISQLHSCYPLLNKLKSNFYVGNSVEKMIKFSRNLQVSMKEFKVSEKYSVYLTPGINVDNNHGILDDIILEAIKKEIANNKGHKNNLRFVIPYGDTIIRPILPVGHCKLLVIDVDRTQAIITTNIFDSKIAGLKDDGGSDIVKKFNSSVKKLWGTVSKVTHSNNHDLLRSGINDAFNKSNFRVVHRKSTYYGSQAFSDNQSCAYQSLILAKLFIQNPNMQEAVQHHRHLSLEKRKAYFAEINAAVEEKRTLSATNRLL